MLDTISMFGTKIYPHRSLFIVIFIFILSCVLLLTWIFPRKEKTLRLIDDNDQEINLLELFNHSFKLIYQAGQTIKRIKNQKKTFQKIFQKKSFEKLQSEPLTIADLVSHSIISQGLKDKFQNLKIVSEEKDPIDNEQVNLIRKEFRIPKKQQNNPPFILYEKQFMTLPLSSVAVWIDPLDATQEFTEDLLEYVTVMLCVTVEKIPTIGIIYAPFTDKLTWAWVDVDHSSLKRNENSLPGTHQPNVDEILISRSHAGDAHQLLQKIYRDKQYKIVPAAGSGYKTVQLLEEYADYYLHITAIKKWDVCAPDAILRAHHGTMTTLANQTIFYDDQKTNLLIKDGLLATYKRNHQALLNFLGGTNLTKAKVH